MVNIEELTKTIFDDVEVSAYDEPGLSNIFNNTIVSDLSDFGLGESLSPDYLADTAPLENEATKTTLLSPVFRRQSARIQDKVRNEIAERIRLENERLEKEAEFLNSDASSNPDLDIQIVSRFKKQTNKGSKNNLKLNSTQESEIFPIDESDIYCICRRPHDDRFMICCDRCDEWFHGDCVGVSPSEGEKMESQSIDFVCPLCRPTEASEVVKYFRDTIQDEKISSSENQNFSIDFSAVKISVKPSVKSIVCTPNNDYLKNFENKKRTKERNDSNDGSSSDDEGFIKKRNPLFENKRVCIAAPEPGGTGIKFQQDMDWKCLGPTCRKRVDLSYSLYCSENCLNHYVQHILEMNTKIQKAKFGNKASLIEAKQHLVLLDRNHGTVYGGSKAPRAKYGELLSFLSSHLTCQVVLTKSSNPNKLSKSSSNKKTHTSSMSSQQINEKKSDFSDEDRAQVVLLRERAKKMIGQSLERRTRESRNLMSVTHGQIRQLVEKLDEALALRYSLELREHSVEDFLKHLLLWKQFFFVKTVETQTNSSNSLTLHQKMGNCLLGALAKNKLTATLLVSADSVEQVEQLAKHFRSSGNSTQVSLSQDAVSGTSAIRDTTSQHDRHMFDLNCNICNPSSKNKVSTITESNLSINIPQTEPDKVEDIITEKDKSPSNDETKPYLDVIPQVIYAPAWSGIIYLSMPAFDATPISTPVDHRGGNTFFKSSIYPMYRIRAQFQSNGQPFPIESTANEFVSCLPEIPKTLHLAKFTQLSDFSNYIHQNLVNCKREVFVYRLLPGSLSFVDERSRNMYHDLYWRLIKQNHCVTVKTVASGVSSSKPGFRDFIIYPGPQLPVPLSCGGEVSRPAYTTNHEAEAPPPTAFGPHSKGAFVYNYFNCDFLTHSKSADLPARVSLYVILMKSLRSTKNTPQDLNSKTIADDSKLINTSLSISETNDDMDIVYSPLVTENTEEKELFLEPEVKKKEDELEINSAENSKPYEISSVAQFSATVKEISTDALRKILANINPSDAAIKNVKKEESTNNKQQKKVEHKPQIIPLENDSINETNSTLAIPGFGDPTSFYSDPNYFNEQINHNFNDFDHRVLHHEVVDPSLMKKTSNASIIYSAKNEHLDVDERKSINTKIENQSEFRDVDLRPSSIAKNETKVSLDPFGFPIDSFAQDVDYRIPPSNYNRPSHRSPHMTNEGYYPPTNYSRWSAQGSNLNRNQNYNYRPYNNNDSKMQEWPYERRSFPERNDWEKPYRRPHDFGDNQHDQRWFSQSNSRKFR